MSQFIIAGLNPAWQRVVEFSSFELEEVNRAEAVSEFASGKGINVSRLLRHYRHTVSVLHFLGGIRGNRIHDICKTWGVHSIPIWQENENRGCTTLIIPGINATECIEPFSVNLKKSLAEEIQQAFTDSHFQVNEKESPILAVTGSMPKGCDEDIVNILFKTLKPGILFLDSIHGWLPGVFHHPLIIKVNEQEWQQKKQIFRMHMQKNNPPLLLITLGRHGALAAVYSEGAYKVFRFTVPILEEVVNVIGAGDAVMAGMLHHWTRHQGVVEVVSSGESGYTSLRVQNLENYLQWIRESLGWGTASCLTLQPGTLDWYSLDSLKKQIKVEEIKERHWLLKDLEFAAKH